MNNLSTSDFVSLIPNPYSAVIQNPTTATGTPIGVALTAASASYYCWVQTRGVASVLSDATVAVQGAQVAPSTTTAGAITNLGTTTGYAVGSAIVAPVSARANPIFLTLE